MCGAGASSSRLASESVKAARYLLVIALVVLAVFLWHWWPLLAIVPVYLLLAFALVKFSTPVHRKAGSNPLKSWLRWTLVAFACGAVVGFYLYARLP